MRLRRWNASVALMGLHYPEGPRVGPDGKLYVSDFYAHEVMSVDLERGAKTHECEVPGQPSGIGWLPDGRLLVVSMRDQRILRREADGRLAVHAELAEYVQGAANDMIVDRWGTAYVGCFGFDLYGILDRNPSADVVFGPGGSIPGAPVVRVSPEGEVSEVACDLGFPNGMAWLSDGSLLVAETANCRITRFEVVPGGGLRHAGTLVDLRCAGPGGASVYPDGICTDAEDGVWVTDPASATSLRIDANGDLTDVVHTSQPCFAVALAGPDGRTLVLCTAQSSLPSVAAADRTGRLEIARVSTPARHSAPVEK